MPVGVTVRVDGLRELQAALRKVADTDLKNELKAIHKAASQRVVAAALPHVPVKTGRLRQSVKAFGSQRSAYAKAGGARVPYAATVHWGRGSGNVNFSTGLRTNYRGSGGAVKGRPFLKDAADAEAKRIGAHYLHDVTALMNKAVRGRNG